MNCTQCSSNMEVDSAGTQSCLCCGYRIEKETEMTNRRIRTWSTTRGISKQAPSDNDWEYLIIFLESAYKTMKYNKVSGYPMHKIEELIEYCEAKRDGDVNGIIDAIADSRIFDANELIKEGYCISDVDDEVLKVIESRCGSWDDKQGKFIKDRSPEAQANWYSPDYVSNCQYKCKIVL